jgi:hypothetical protein
LCFFFVFLYSNHSGEISSTIHQKRKRQSQQNDEDNHERPKRKRKCIHSEKRDIENSSCIGKDYHHDHDCDQKDKNVSQQIVEILQQNANKCNEEIYYVRLVNGKTLWVRKHHVPNVLLHRWRIQNNNNNNNNNNK